MILDDGRKLVGVRVPTAALASLRQHLNEAVQIRETVVSDVGGGTIESITPLDLALLKKAKTAPKTMHSFFFRIPSASSPSPSPGSAPPGAGMLDKKRKMEGTGSGSASGSGKKKSRGAGLERGGRVAKGVAALFGGSVAARGAGKSSEVSSVGGGRGNDVVLTDVRESREIEIIDIDDD